MNTKTSYISYLLKRIITIWTAYIQTNYNLGFLGDITDCHERHHSTVDNDNKEYLYIVYDKICGMNIRDCVSNP